MGEGVLAPSPSAQRSSGPCAHHCQAGLCCTEGISLHGCSACRRCERVCDSKAMGVGQ